MSSSTDAFQSRILIVDDQESNVRLLEFALRRGGYVAVTSTIQALDVCTLHRENPFDLILLDLQMPRTSGFDVLGALANEYPVAVLILSADPTQEARARAAGANDFLSKPFVLAEVLARVQRILGKSPDKSLIGSIDEPLVAVQVIDDVKVPVLTRVF